MSILSVIRYLQGSNGKTRTASLSALLIYVVAYGTATKAEPVSDLPELKIFMQEMSDRHGFDAAYLSALFAGAEIKPGIIEAISRPAEKKPWYEYRPIFLTSGRIDGGIRFWERNEKLLQAAYKRYGVDPEIIVAIIGVETRYGRHTGTYRVLDALSTLGFRYPPRASFFRSELEQFLLLSREEKIDPRSATGSYAGAMGLGQFIPSSYRRYAVDFDGDGQRDLWNNNADAIGSVANYLHEHGWEPGQLIASRASVHGKRFRTLLGKGLKPSTNVLKMRQYGVEPVTTLPGHRLATLIELEFKSGMEYWIGLNNFYVITRYNHSALYAMAVYQLAQEIAAARKAVTIKGSEYLKGYLSSTLTP